MGTLKQSMTSLCRQRTAIQASLSCRSPCGCWLPPLRSARIGGGRHRSLQEAYRSMVVRVGVVDPLPMFQNGILAALGGLTVTSKAPDDALAWARGEDFKVLLLTLAASPDWDMLTQLRDSGKGLAVIAVLEV